MSKRARGHVLSAIFLCMTAALAFAAPLRETRAQQQSAVPVWPQELIRNLEKLRDAALSSDYALRQAAHLTENIGPRLSGSPQAQQAVEYVSGELRRLGLDVKLQKIMVPHWVRGEERAKRTGLPEQAPGT